MRRYIVVFVLLLLSIAVSAQNRVVRGVVFDASHIPFKGVLISVSGYDISTVSKDDGTFELTVPTYCRSVTASKEGFLSSSLEIDGSYLVFTMKLDKDWEKEQAAKVAAKAKHVADSTAAVQAAQKAAAAKAAEEEAARIAAEKDAAKKAAKEEAERIAAEKAVAKKAVADSIAREKKAEKKALINQYNSKYKNRGLINSIDFAYGYQLKQGDVVFTDRGWRKYGDQIPLILTYSIGYRINYLFAVSAGAGVLYDVRNISIKNDSFASGYYPDFKLKQIDVPVFVKADLFMARGKVQPLLSVSGGLYVLSMTPLVDGGLGCSIRVSKSTAINILASVRTTPWPYFYEHSKSAGYKMALTPGVKLGISF
ncbi:MAG: hypothetical protein SO437_07235 [Candidatus Cryptobacteroides sp.]|nr:hypothetical protein [Candidatus Cryptobacteroides sp.]